MEKSFKKMNSYRKNQSSFDDNVSSHKYTLIYLWKNKEFNWIKSLIFKAVMVISVAPTTALIAFAAANLSEGQSKIRLFMMFILTFSLYQLAFNKFYKGVTYTVENKVAHIRKMIMDQIRQSELITFEQIGVNKIYTALTYDIKAVSDISQAIASSMIAVVLLSYLMIFLAIISIAAFGIILVTLLFSGLIYLSNQIVIKDSVFASRDYEKKMLKSFRNILFGFKDLKLNDKKNDDFFYNELKINTRKLSKSKIKSASQFVTHYSLTFGMWQLLIILVVLVLPVLGISSSDKLVVIIGIILFMPFGQLMEQIPRLTLATISFGRLFALKEELARLNKEIKPPVSLLDNFVFKKISFENITFTYTGDERHNFQIGPLSVTFKANEITFITGGNGSGKSTLLKLITGLYPIHSGNIYLNDEQIDIQRYRALFSAIFTDYHLFDRFYGVTNKANEYIDQLIKLMELDQKIKYTDDRFDDISLSTGQRKRLAFIMNMAENKPINIYDEWAADQDPHFRKLFYHKLLPMQKNLGKAVIAVTHDEKFFYLSDRRLILERGKRVYH